MLSCMSLIPFSTVLLLYLLLQNKFKFYYDLLFSQVVLFCLDPHLEPLLYLNPFIVSSFIFCLFFVFKISCSFTLIVQSNYCLNLSLFTYFLTQIFQNMLFIQVCILLYFLFLLLQKFLLTLFFSLIFEWNSSTCLCATKNFNGFHLISFLFI